MKKMIKMLSLVLALTLCLSFFAGCAPAADNANTSEDANTNVDSSQVAVPAELTKIGLAIPSTAIFFEAEQKQAEKICAERGIELVTVIADNDAAKQQNQIEDLISQGCQAIIIVLVDKDAILSSLEVCKEAGVYTICCGRQPADMTNCDVFISADNDEMTRLGVEALLEGADEVGLDKIRVVEFVGKLTDQNAVERTEYFKKYAEASGRIEIVGQVSTEWNQDTAFSRFSDLYNTLGGEFDALFIPADSYITPAESVLQANNDWGKKGEDGYHIIIGMDGSATAISYILDGYAYATVNSDPGEFINASIDAATKLVKGEAVDQVIAPELMAVSMDEIEKYGDSIWGVAYLEK